MSKVIKGRKHGAARAHNHAPHVVVPQTKLRLVYRQRQEVEELQRIAAAKKEKVQKQEDDLLATLRHHGTEVEPGAFKPLRRKIQRRIPHYKDETAALARKAGYDPDDYLEKCRNRGHVITYWRLSLGLVE